MEALVGIVLIITIGIALYWIFTWRHRYAKPEAPPDPNRHRVRDCGKVVTYFANHYGQFARQAVTREELSDAIDMHMDAAELAMFIKLRMEQSEGIYLGSSFDNALGGIEFPIKLPQSIRSKHMYLIGSTGSGKTTALLNMILQDLENNEGLAFIAPDSEFFEEELLPSIPAHRIDDIVYFNPHDNNRLVCFNPLDIEEGEDLTLRAEDTYTIFARAIPDLGARAEPLLRNAIYALTALENVTINDLPQLLNPADPTLRERALAHPKVDKHTKEFFQNVFPSYPKDAHLPILNRFDSILRGKVAQFLSGTSIKFSDIMDGRKVFLANLSTGLLGDDPSKLLGQLLVSKFLTTAYKRDSIPKSQRTPFYFYIDEFQTYAETASSTYSEILARARKYQLALILAHQQTRQLDPRLLEDILGNVATIFAMRIGDRDARRFKSILYTGHEVEKSQAIQTHLQEFPTGRAFIKLPSQEAIMLQAPFVEGSNNADRKMEIREASREHYGLSLAPPKSPDESQGDTAQPSEATVPDASTPASQATSVPQKPLPEEVFKDEDEPDFFE